MSKIYALTSQPLTRCDAHELMNRLDNAVVPEASAVSMNEVDEDNELWQVLAYYEYLPDSIDFPDILLGLDVTADALSIAPLPQIDWVEASLEGLAPVVAGRFFVHGSHEKIRPAGGITLEIDAGTAFGTGHHGTTRGCLTALDCILKARRPCRVLDLGCGTGVLAIATARAAHCQVTASDIDPEAVRVTRHNARLNRAGHSFSPIIASGTHDRRIASGAPYDLIFANILARPLIGLAPAIVQLAEIGGDIVLSGLLVQQERWVLAAYRSRGVILRRRVHLEGWSTLWLSRHRHG